MPGVFISYRRGDSAGHAGRLFDRLTQHFGSSHVFLDVAGIELGVDFMEAVQDAVSSADVLVVVIGREWLDCTDSRGLRRLEDPNDFVRLEIATALRNGIRIIPVLVQGASTPAREHLPEDLQDFCRRQAMELSDIRWDSDVGLLIRSLEKTVKTKSPSIKFVGTSDKTPSPSRKAKRSAERNAIDISVKTRVPKSVAVLDPGSSGSAFGPGKTIVHNGHRIRIRYSLLFIGVEYDGQEVPSDSTTRYVFDVIEDGKKAHYEINIVDDFLSWRCEVRRSGRVIFSDIG